MIITKTVHISFGLMKYNELTFFDSRNSSTKHCAVTRTSRSGIVKTLHLSSLPRFSEQKLVLTFLLVIYLRPSLEYANSTTRLTNVADLIQKTQQNVTMLVYVE